MKDVSGAKDGHGLKDVGNDKLVEVEAVAVENFSGAEDGNRLKDVGDDKSGEE